MNVFLDDAVWSGLAMVEMSERSVVVRIAAIVTPLPFVSLLAVQLDIFLNYTVWAGLTVVEMSEWTVVV